MATNQVKRPNCNHAFVMGPDSLPIIESVHDSYWCFYTSVSRSEGYHVAIFHIDEDVSVVVTRYGCDALSSSPRPRQSEQTKYCGRDGIFWHVDGDFSGNMAHGKPQLCELR